MNNIYMKKQDASSPRQFQRKTLEKSQKLAVKRFFMTFVKSTPEPLCRTKRVLSIQSHVVHGYVGNKAATFPLQYRGWDVDALNTVQYSNHPGYGSFNGYKSSGIELCDIIRKGLLEGLGMDYDAILTGYIPDGESFSQIGALLCDYTNKNASCKWVLDPVLGDNGRLYVSESIIAIYKQILSESRIFLATPNHFEMETLTGIKIVNLDSLKEAFIEFYSRFPRVTNIVVTSVEILADSLITACCETDKKPNGMLTVHCIQIPKIKAQFSGSGDLLTALLLDYLHTSDTSQSAITLQKAVQQVLDITKNILNRALTLTNFKDRGSGEIPSVKDLKLIQSRDLLLLPPQTPSEAIKTIVL